MKRQSGQLGSQRCGRAPRFVDDVVDRGHTTTVLYCRRVVADKRKLHKGGPRHLDPTDDQDTRAAERGVKVKDKEKHRPRVKWDAGGLLVGILSHTTPCVPADGR